VFGGSREITGTWAWDGRRWRQVVDSAGSPHPRVGAPMAWDPGRRRMVMVGGQSRRAPNAPPWRCDTWTYNGRAWAMDHDGPCVAERPANSVLAYDSRRRTMLLVTGTSVGADTVLRTTRIWRWTERGWALVDSTGPRRRGFSNAAFDDARGVLVVPVLYGGPDAGTWEWDGSRWRHSTARYPTTRQTYALAYDPQTQRTLLMGGQGSSRGPYLDDAWAWDGSRWTELPRESGVQPAGRGGANLVRDTANDRFIYFGGYNEQPLTDLWVGDARGWRLWTSPDDTGSRREW
jgi:hypothetical protein